MICPACDPSEVEDAVDEGQARGDALVFTSDGAMSGEAPNVQFAIASDVLMTIDEAFIAQTSLAQGRCDDSDVCQFADQVFNDHATHLQGMKEMLGALKIARIDNAVSRQLRDESADTQFMLIGSTRFDFDFMFSQVSLHEESLEIVKHYEDSVDDGPAQNVFDDTGDFLQDDAFEAQRLLPFTDD